MRRINIISICFLLLITLTGCGEVSVFEKRYVRIEIPGYAEKDYIHLLDSPDPELRYNAIANLIEMNAFESEKLPEITELHQKIKSLLTDASPKVRSIAAFSIKSIGADSFERALIKLTNDPSDAVRLEAISTLGQKYTESPEAAKAILAHLDDKSILVRLQAIESLANCRKSALRSEIVKKLLSKLPKTNQIEQLKIIETLGLIGESKEVDLVLLEMLNSNEDAVITTTIEALGRLKVASAIKMFPDLLHRGLGKKEAIVNALSSIGTPEAMQLLIKLLDIEDQEVQIAAIEAIGRSQGDQGLKELVKKFSEEEQKIIKEVDSVKWVDWDSYPKLVVLMEAIEQKILIAGDKFKEPPIIRFLESENDYEKMIGLVLLTEGKPYDRVVIQPRNEGQNIFPYLERLANNPSPFIRALCLHALGNISDSRALPILENAIENSPFGIRYTTIQALGNYVDNTSNYAPLRRLYEKKEKFIPRTYTKGDKDFLIRQLIETTIANSECKYLTHQRRVSELASPSNPTRLIAALRLAEENDDVAMPVLLIFLEKGIMDEQQAALSGLEKFSSASTDVISKLQAIKAKQEDRTLREKIDRVIKKLHSK